MYVASGRAGRGCAGGGSGEERRGTARVTPIGSVNGHLDVWIDVFVHDLVPHCVLWTGQLLSRDDLPMPRGIESSATASTHQMIGNWGENKRLQSLPNDAACDDASAPYRTYEDLQSCGEPPV